MGCLARYERPGRGGWLPDSSKVTIDRHWPEVAVGTERPDPIAPLQRGDVFILDEAGLAPSRDIRRLLVEAQKVGAKVMLVGNAQQLQAIEAGAAFRALVDTHGDVELTDVRRQRTDWQRTASQLFAQQHGPEALALYRENGAVHGAQTTEQAMDALVDTWIDGRSKEGEQLVLAHTKT